MIPKDRRQRLAVLRAEIEAALRGTLNESERSTLTNRLAVVNEMLRGCELPMDALRTHGKYHIVFKGKLV